MLIFRLLALWHYRGLCVIKLFNQKHKAMKPNSTNPKIFIVEDNALYAQLLKRELENNKYNNIQVFSKGEDCISALNQNPDIILLDYQLDGKLTGIDVLGEIKKLGKDIKVVFLTAHAKLDLALNALRLGAYDYVIKNPEAFSKIRALVNCFAGFFERLREENREKKYKAAILGFIASIVILSVWLQIRYPQIMN
jgi:DNA-binding NtrC family response regulator